MEEAVDLLNLSSGLQNVQQTSNKTSSSNVDLLGGLADSSNDSFGDFASTPMTNANFVDFSTSNSNTNTSGKYIATIVFIYLNNKPKFVFHVFCDRIFIKHQFKHVW